MTVVLRRELEGAYEPPAGLVSDQFCPLKYKIQIVPMHIYV